MSTHNMFSWRIKKNIDTIADWSGPLLSSCNGWKNSCCDWGSNPVHWTQKLALYRIAIKASLCSKAVQVYKCIIYLSLIHIPSPFSDLYVNLNFSTQYQATKPLGPPSPSDWLNLHWAWVSDVTDENILCRNWGSNLVCWTQSHALYCIAIKAVCSARQYKCIIYLSLLNLYAPKVPFHMTRFIYFLKSIKTII